VEMFKVTLLNDGLLRCLYNAGIGVGDGGQGANIFREKIFFGRLFCKIREFC